MPNDYQYLFLGGIIGEVLGLPFVGNYLKVNKKILNSMGITDVECRTLNSYKSAEDNAHTLAVVIEQLFQKNNKKIVILGHSKACLELILSLIEYLPVFQERVHKVVCVQPPFQGSSIFEKFNFLKYVSPLWPGLKCLEAEHYSRLFAEKLIPDEETHAYLRENLLVIRGFKENSSDVAWIIRPSHFVMKRIGHANDGLVKLKDQSIPLAEYSEIVLEMDHSDLFTSSLISTKDDEFRRKVMAEVLDWCLGINELSEAEKELFIFRGPAVPAKSPRVS